MSEQAAGGEERARQRILDWLADVGPRWGVPAEACTVHGWLYLAGRSSEASEIAGATGLPLGQVEDSLRWLERHRIAWRKTDGEWATGADPWDLVVRVLEVRRERELGPALATLRTAAADVPAGSPLRSRIGSLLGLVEDIVAIDAQASRLSSAALRRLIGGAGRAARLIDRALGGGQR